MICPTCANEGIENEVLGKKFYYCRTCKDEIRLGEAAVDDIVLWGDLSCYQLGSDPITGQWIYYCGYCNQRDGTKHAQTCARPKQVTKRAGTTAFDVTRWLSTNQLRSAAFKKRGFYDGS